MCISMTNFSTNCTHRTKAYSVLLAWMFALISGVANACLVELQSSVIRSKPATYSTQEGAKHTNLVEHFKTEAGLAQKHDAHLLKQPCSKVCNNFSKSLLEKNLTAQIDNGSVIVGAALWSLIEPIRLQYKQPNGSKHAASLLPLTVVYSKLVFQHVGASSRAQP